MSARHFKYYDNWKSEILTCPKCGWTGTFGEGSVEHYDQLKDCSCPVCDPAPMLAIVEYPTMEESGANWNKVSEAEKARLDFRSAFLAEWEASLLKSETQLPDLDGAFLIILAWDMEGEEKRTTLHTVIKHGKEEIWRELTCYEGADRFAEVVAILKKKYGSRLIDLVPTRRSYTYLYGDHASSLDVVRKARESLGGRPLPEPSLIWDNDHHTASTIYERAQRSREALLHAMAIHGPQLRKGPWIPYPVPYVGHILSVAGIAIDHGCTTLEATAAVLHDAVEDQGGKATADVIRARFVEEVYDIVMSCTDAVVTPKPPWRERKDAYLAKLRTASPSVRLVAAADKLDNARAILRDYLRDGEDVWSRFNGGREGTLWYYRAVVDVLRADGPRGGCEGFDSIVTALDSAVTEIERLCRVSSAGNHGADEEGDDAEDTGGSVSLYRERGTTSIMIDASITGEGDLQVSGYDVGSAPSEFIGSDDYEYWLTVPREQKDRVLLLLIKKLYGGDSGAVSGFQRFLESKGVTCKFETWR